MKELLISHYVETTRVLGPYERSALWVHGCRFDCPGCIAHEMNQSPPSVRTADELKDVFCAVKGTEGITLSGGEPFLQAEALSDMLEGIKRERDYGVIVYTGFIYEELLESSSPDVKRLMDLTDILIDGPYMEDLDDGKPFRGSSNQRILPLTERYRDVTSEYYEGSDKRNIEINVRESGVYMVGVPSKHGLMTWREFKRKAGGKVWANLTYTDGII